MTTSRPGRIDRRRLVASSAIGGATILTGGSLVRGATETGQPAALLAQDDSADVSMFRGNAARTGEMPGPGPDDAVGVEVIWTFATGGDLWSSPAVVDGVIYVGSTDTNLYAVNADDGMERWRFATGGSVSSSPAVVDGVVYFGSGDNNLYAVSAKDGAEVWRFATGDAVASSPAVVDGVIYVGSSDTYLYAVDAENGTERWRFAAGNVVISAPAAVDGVVYVEGGDSALYAVSAEDGTERWRFRTDGTSIVGYSPAAVDGAVYFERFGTLYAVGAEDGTERWRFPTGGYGLAGRSPAVADEVVYIGTSDLYALNAEDGTERWQFSTGNDILSSPSVVDGVVYVGIIDLRGENARVFAVDAEDGTERWQFPGGGVAYSPVVVDGVVFAAGGGVAVPNADGPLYAFGATQDQYDAMVGEWYGKRRDVTLNADGTGVIDIRLDAFGNGLTYSIVVEPATSPVTATIVDVTPHGDNVDPSKHPTIGQMVTLELQTYPDGALLVVHMNHDGPGMSVCSVDDEVNVQNMCY